MPVPDSTIAASWLVKRAASILGVCSPAQQGVVQTSKSCFFLANGNSFPAQNSQPPTANYSWVERLQWFLLFQESEGWSRIPCNCWFQTLFTTSAAKFSFPNVSRGMILGFPRTGNSHFPGRVGDLWSVKMGLNRLDALFWQSYWGRNLV